MKASGTAVPFSMTMGRMQACGQTREHWLHWMQFSGIHSGTLTAMPRFSYLVVPVGTTPAGLNAETGSESPLWARMGLMTSSKCLVAGTLTATAPVVALAHSAGTGISTRPPMAASMASQFFLTTASPFLA